MKKTTAAASLVLMFAVAGPSVAQVRVGVEQTNLTDIHRRAVRATPNVGPPGTIVNIQAWDLPVAAPLRVGIGALRFGFEEAGWVLSDYDGEIEMSVVIPDWARNDVVHVIIVFDPYFAPLALSHVVHVTDENGLITRTGALSDVGTGCVTLLGEDEVPYVVSGNLRGFSAGDMVQVEGTVGQSSRCDGRTEISVRSIAAPGT